MTCFFLVRDGPGHEQKPPRQPVPARSFEPIPFFHEPDLAGTDKGVAALFVFEFDHAVDRVTSSRNRRRMQQRKGDRFRLRGRDKEGYLRARAIELPGKQKGGFDSF